MGLHRQAGSSWTCQTMPNSPYEGTLPLTDITQLFAPWEALKGT